jgi:CRISPR-associated endonuclease/helicase Cas3
MNALPENFLEYQSFGKLSYKQNPAAWLPLVDHMTDVALCFIQLCQCHSIRRSLEKVAAQNLDDADIARLAVLVFLHDLGKANSGFQSKRWPHGQRPSPDFWPPTAGHGKEALALFSERHQQLAILLPLDAMDAWGEAVEPLLIASISHHGRPLLDDGTQISKKVWQPVHDGKGQRLYDPSIIIAEISRKVTALFPLAFGTVERPLPDSPAFGHLFAGLVQFADWLGSDTCHFPIRIDADRGEAAKAYAEQAITALGLDSSTTRKRLTETPLTFARAFDAPAPYPIQAAMTDDNLGPLVILESETGSGKTEAALWRFLHLYQSGQVDSLYFALPTRVSAKQIYDRVRQTIDRLWPQDPPLVLRALPGYSAADGEEPVMLPDFKVQWNDEPSDDEALRRWAAEAPKRFLAAPIAVGTIDQALLGILKVKHAHMRYALLARSLLVVDEVHASDAYMTALLEKLLKGHLGNGGHALLLSATLGSSARARYLTLGKASVQPPSIKEASNTAYPAISDHQKLRPMNATGRTKTVRWSLHDCIDDPETIAELALNAARTGAKVLVVRNTVKAAMELFQIIDSRPEANHWLFRVNGQASLHHSRFSRHDRPLLDAAIEAELGKQRPPGARILIGTQTLEQSLDIDADLLITDLCPMDVLLQRIGRLHRHQRYAHERSAAYAAPQALILTPKGQDLSPMLNRAAYGLGRFSKGGGVYPDLRIIEATRRLIAEQPKIRIPADNRRLVEEATHPAVLQAIKDELKQGWIKHSDEVEGETLAMRTTANVQILNIDKPFDDNNAGFPKDQKIATRLGAEDRLILFEPPPAGPFGEPLKQIPIRAHLLPNGLPLDTEPREIVTSDGVTEFSLGEARYRYSRIGLERIEQ